MPCDFLLKTEHLNLIIWNLEIRFFSFHKVSCFLIVEGRLCTGGRSKVKAYGLVRLFLSFLSFPGHVQWLYKFSNIYTWFWCPNPQISDFQKGKGEEGKQVIYL